eukprot:GHRR01022215.1.p1 GENE.GHRR01022215.1~~GHRR01022215.1.p1  ORF type:complete len:274 (+),score=54.17 GHRR01022215.1:238-1059(+)
MLRSLVTATVWSPDVISQLSACCQTVTRLITTHVTRDPSYSKVNAEDIHFFKEVLGDRGVVQDETALEAMNRDWMGKYSGHSKVALKPTITDQVSRLLAYCAARRLAVVPQGGNTGLVGGSVPVFDEIVLNLANMNKILSFDEVSGVIVAQAGCILQQLDSHVSERGYIMPLDLGAKGSCHIGGNVSTNAGVAGLVSGKTVCFMLVSLESSSLSVLCQINHHLNGPGTSGQLSCQRACIGQHAVARVCSQQMIKLSVITSTFAALIMPDSSRH